MGFFFSVAIIKPIKIIAIFVFRYFIIHLYRIYFIIKKWLGSIFAPAKNKVIYPLLNKSTIHIILAAIAVAVIANNFVIREIGAEEVGQKTILAAMITSPSDVEIVETALSEIYTTTDYYRETGVLAARIGSLNEMTTQNNEENEIMTTESSAALVKPGLASTTIGDRPREKVVYYTVEPGDTVSTIAEKFNVSTNTLLWENKLGPRDYIKPGDKLTILPMSGVSHQVKKGDTIEKIATKYGADADTILEYNKLADASAIEVDQIIIIPGGTMPAPPKPKWQPTTSGLAFIPPSAQASSGTKLQWPTTSHKLINIINGDIWPLILMEITAHQSMLLKAAVLKQWDGVEVTVIESSLITATA